MTEPSIETVNDKKKRKKEKKEKKKRKREEEESNSEESPLEKKDRKSRREERKKLLEQLPKTDENGISYTKQQLRRMAKRVSRGLDPIETSKEKHERLQNEAELRRQEEAELAGMVYRKPQDEEDDESGSERDVDDNNEESKRENTVQDDEAPSRTKEASQPVNNTKKTKRNKPVPSDYVCFACKNASKPLHWIYDCPKKVTMKGTNQVAKKLRGNNPADDNKVFVSGLPFSMKRGDVTKLFLACGKIAHTKIVLFPDTGRCKGQAYVTFESKEGAAKALELSGSVIDNDDGASKEKSSKSPSTNKRKELKLKVTKALNRIATKSSKSN